MNAISLATPSIPVDALPGAMFVAAGLLGLLILLLVYLLIQWIFQKRGGPDLPPPGKEGARGLTVALQIESIDELCRRVEDALVARLSRQTETVLESENRTKSELLEMQCKIDVLAQNIRQNSKEIGTNEQLLNDIVQILNINISESKTLAQKLQRLLDDPAKPLLPHTTQRLKEIR